MSATRSKSPINWSKRDHRVYLIEDDHELRLQLVATLREVGFVVQEFATAEDFLAETLDCGPAVILADMVLPGLSGLDLLKSIRQAVIESPLIFISGYSQPHQIIEGMKLGAVDFLWKPFKSETLCDAVHQALTAELQRDQQQRAMQSLLTRWNSLSQREQEVCKLILLGHGSSKIAELLNIQPDTANKHRMKVLKKLAVDGRPQLIELLKGFAPAST